MGQVIALTATAVRQFTSVRWSQCPLCDACTTSKFGTMNGGHRYVCENPAHGPFRWVENDIKREAI